MLFVLASMIPLIFSGLVIVYYSASKCTDTIHNNLNNSTEQIGVFLNKYFYEDVLQKSQTLAAYISAIEEQNFDEKEKSFLIKQQLASSNFCGLMLFPTKSNSSNTRYSKTKNNPPEIVFSYAESFADSLNKTFQVNPVQYVIKYFWGDTLPYVLTAVPVKGENIPVNVIVSISQLSELHSLFQDLSKEKAVSLCLVDDKGEYMCGKFRTERDSLTILGIKNFIRHHYKTRSNKGDLKDSIIESEVINGKKYLFRFKYLNSMDKSITAISPAVTMKSIFQNIYLEMVLVLILTLMLAILAQYYVFIRIIKPIRRLTDAASRVAKGDFDVKIENINRDNIGDLTQVFNSILSQIRTFNQINIDKIIVERKKLEHIIEQMVAGILIVDPENNILICNNVFADWYRLDKKTILNKKLSAIEELKVFHTMIEDLNWKRSPEVKQERIENYNGTKSDPQILQAVASNIFTSGKTFLATSIYVRDITKEVEVDKLKTELLSIVAHELRSPLVSIIGFSEMLKDGDLDQELNMEYNRIIYDESIRLSAFVDQFLDLTRIESGSFPMHLKEENFTKTVRQSIKLFQSQAKYKNIKLQTEFSSSPMVLKYDNDLIARSIGNYLSNAIKYSPSGSVVKIRTFLDNNRAVLEIEDNGQGISDDNLNRIFDKFYRVKNTATKDKKGSGLGLAFVKQVIEKHNGRVYVKSRLKEGSVFGFSIPLD